MARQGNKFFEYYLIMNNRKHQKTTQNADAPEVSDITGLTPLQEKSAILLAAGETLTAVANKLGINRSTIYKWQMQMAFQCYYNQQCKDYKNNLKNGLFGLADEALTAVKSCLHSNNEATRLKTAMWIADKVEFTDIGISDVRTAIREQHSNLLNIDSYGFDEQGYKDELRDMGLNLDE